MWIAEGSAVSHARCVGTQETSRTIHTVRCMRARRCCTAMHRGALQVWLEQYARTQEHLATKGEVAAAVEASAKQVARDVDGAMAPKLEEVSWRHLQGLATFGGHPSVSKALPAVAPELLLPLPTQPGKVRRCRTGPIHSIHSGR